MRFLPYCLLCLLLSCCAEGPRPKVRGTGPTVTESRPAQAIENLEANADIEVVLTQGSQPAIKVEGQQNVLDELRTDISGGRLQLHFNRIKLGAHAPVKVYVTTPHLTALSVSSSGSVTSPSIWTGNQLRINVSGSGSATLACEQLNRVQTDMSGSGTVTLRGTTQGVAVNMSGSGQVHAFNLLAQEGEVSLSGSGTSNVRVASRLTVHISGSGVVRYKGQPQISSHLNGSGRVVNAN